MRPTPTYSRETGSNKTFASECQVPVSINSAHVLINTYPRSVSENTHLGMNLLRIGMFSGS